MKLRWVLAWDVVSWAGIAYGYHHWKKGQAVCPSSMQDLRG